MASLVEIGPTVLEKKIFIFRQYIFTPFLLSPLKKSVVLHLNKLESSSPKNVLYLVWLNLVGSGKEEENVKSL